MALVNSSPALKIVRNSVIAGGITVLAATVTTACGFSRLDNLSTGATVTTAEGGAAGSEEHRGSGGDEQAGGRAGDSGAGGNAGTANVAGNAGDGGEAGLAASILGYALKARHSDKCVGINGPTTVVGNQSLGQATCNGAQAQTFELLDNADGFLALRARGTGACADVERRSENDGANIILWACHGEINQLWQKQRLDGKYFQFVSRLSLKCLDVQSGSSEENAAIVQNTCSGSISQSWELIPIYLEE